MGDEQAASNIPMLSGGLTSQGSASCYGRRTSRLDDLAGNKTASDGLTEWQAHLSPGRSPKHAPARVRALKAPG